MFLNSWIFNIIVIIIIIVVVVVVVVIIIIILTVGVISSDFTSLIGCRCRCIEFGLKFLYEDF